MKPKAKRLPRVYPETQEEHQAWLNLVNQVKKEGVLNYLFRLQSSTPNERVTKTESVSKLDYDIDATTIHTVEQLIEACNIDMNTWQVGSFRTSTWQQKENGTQLFSVRATFIRREENSLHRFIERIEQGLYKYQSQRHKAHKNTSENVNVINIYDAHIDKVTRLNETGKQSNIQNNCEQFRQAFDVLLGDAPKGRFLFPVGNDFFNVNDGRNTTFKGTPQDTELHHIDTFEIGVNLIRDCIDKMAKIGNVDVLIIAGNHAKDLEYLLGVTLAQIYRNDERVNIRYDRMSRKYYKWGENMLMFQHGDKMKKRLKELGNIMATEQPAMWAQCPYRYALFGDIHHERKFEQLGVTAMFLRAMSQPDKWHTEAGYISRRSAYLHTFKKDGGKCTEVCVNF